MIGTLNDLCERLNISRPTASEICKRKGAPAWRLSSAPKSPWRVDLDRMEVFLRTGRNERGTY